MSKGDCDRQFDVLQAAGSGHVAFDLREHLDVCSSCRDLLEVASAVVDDRNTLMRDTRLPGSGLVWWRASMRAQREAARAAVRTASLVQVSLLVLAVIIAVTLLGIDYRTILTSVTSSLGRFTVPLLALAAWLILAPVAVYFAVTEE